jgi:hypothetical protein
VRATSSRRDGATRDCRSRPASRPSGATVISPPNSDRQEHATARSLRMPAA